MLPGPSLECGSRLEWVERMGMVKENLVGWKLGRECLGQSLKIICGVGRESHSRP